MTIEKLKVDFFEQNCVTVARELIGCQIHFNGHEGIIFETESYRGYDDPASHAYKGVTPRTEPMFGSAGNLYVYLIYGMYHCMNVVTENKGIAAAVLIRGIKFLHKSKLILDGPGKICKYLSVDKNYNNLSIVDNNNMFIVNKKNLVKFESTPRIGIKSGLDKDWRFIANYKEL